MEHQHPPNPPDDLPGQLSAKSPIATIPLVKVQLESEVQAYGNNDLSWQEQSEQMNIDGEGTVPVHPHDEQMLDHDVWDIRPERMRIN
jgi:hypothetical protein